MKVLVAVASRHGSTAEIGERIAATLSSGGVETTILAPEHVTSLTGYDAVVIGSAVYMGSWLESTKTFVGRFGAELSQIPVWAFSSGPLGDPPKPSEPSAEVLDLIDRLRPREHCVFAGAIDPSELGLTERVITRVVKAPKGDFRDWSTVEEWARRIAATLADELGWRHDNALERDQKLREFWRQQMESPEPVG